MAFITYPLFLLEKLILLISCFPSVANKGEKLAKLTGFVTKLLIEGLFVLFSKLKIASSLVCDLTLHHVLIAILTPWQRIEYELMSHTQ